MRRDIRSTAGQVAAALAGLVEYADASLDNGTPPARVLRTLTNALAAQTAVLRAATKQARPMSQRADYSWTRLRRAGRVVAHTTHMRHRAP